MSTIVITPKNKDEEEFITQLLERMNVEAHLVEESLSNYKTRRAMKDVEEQKGNRVEDSDELFDQLGI